MLERKDILSECVERCMEEMYKYSQPAIDLKSAVEKIKQKEIVETKEHPLYTQHYLSFRNYQFILKHYLNIYGLFDYWDSDMELLIHNLKEGGVKNKYIPPQDGNPGYRGYEDVKPLQEYIGKEHSDIVFKILEDYKNFHKHGSREYDQVYMSIALGASPTSNKKAVINYWKSQGITLDIKDIDVESIYYGDDNEEYDNTETTD